MIITFNKIKSFFFVLKINKIKVDSLSCDHIQS